MSFLFVGSTQPDLLSGDLELGEEEKDDMALLNEIFDSPSTGSIYLTNFL